MAGDGDDVDIIEAAERTFGVSFSNDEASAIHTVGHFHDVIAAKLVASGTTTACFTQAAFYRLRHAAIANGATRSIRPSDPVSALLLNVHTQRDLRRTWRELSMTSGLKLPALSAPGSDRPSASKIRRTMAAALFLAAGAIAAAAWFKIGVTALALIVGLAVMYLIIQRTRETIPSRLQSIGQLAEEAAGETFGTLNAAKGSHHPKDLWFAVVALCRTEVGFRDPIDRETTFFARDAHVSC